MKLTRLFGSVWVLSLAMVGSALRAAPATEPAEESAAIKIPAGVPQFVGDDYLVDNHWAIRYKRQAVTVVSHPLTKHADNPIFDAGNASYMAVVRELGDSGDSLFRMYYQGNFLIGDDGASDTNQEVLPGTKTKGRKYRTEVCYAESADGINWTKPVLDIFAQKTHAKPNNVVIGFPDHQQFESSAPFFVEGLPEADQRGYRYVLSYRVKGKGSGEVSGIRLIGTHDGIHFDFDNDTRIAHLHSDCPNTVSYDENSKDYVIYCRAKQMYRAFGEEMIDTGASRRVASMRNGTLWEEWMEKTAPKTLLVPDEIDAASHFNFFYGMPTVRRHGLYWGFLEVFRMNDFIYTELATSRDGDHFKRASGRAKLIEYGDDGSWDDTMIFTSPHWVEVGDEWWFYYSGWDGPHGTTERSGKIGVATCKKERLISRRGPAGGGVVCSRTLVWPGGDLQVNAAALEEGGQVKVRVSDSRRRVIDGYDYDDGDIFSGDSLSHRVRWGDDLSLDELKGQTVRLEFYLQNADLFSFTAETAN